MSLWHKPMDAVTYEEIEAFCLVGQAEGLRLDYKAQLPSDLQKLVAAFANTLGGLIILGIEADKTTNMPVWPPKGMPKKPGIEEQITAICRDTIYPPVRPQISPIIDNPHAPGTVLVVLRVDESPDAPHAVRGLIYERTGSQGHPVDLSQIERISHLLGRRGRIEQQRAELFERDLARAARQLRRSRHDLRENIKVPRPEEHPPGLRDIPLRWASVLPVYPWKDLCEPRACYESLRCFGIGNHTRRQRTPGGATDRKDRFMGPGKADVDVGIYSLSSKGHVFAMECTTETLGYRSASRLGAEMLQRETPDDLFLSFEATQQFAEAAFRAAREFYRQPHVEHPGYVRIAIGLLDVLDVKMTLRWGSETVGKPFIDEEFMAEITMSGDQFLEEADTEPLFRDLRFGFDL